MFTELYWLDDGDDEILGSILSLLAMGHRMVHYEYNDKSLLVYFSKNLGLGY